MVHCTLRTYTSTHILCTHLAQCGILHRRQQLSSLLQATLQRGAEVSLSRCQVLGVAQALPADAPQVELSLCLAAVCRSPQVGCRLQAQHLRHHNERVRTQQGCAPGGAPPLTCRLTAGCWLQVVCCLQGK